MAKGSPQLEWCVVRLGEDHNWWVDEISDPVWHNVMDLNVTSTFLCCRAVVPIIAAG